MWGSYRASRSNDVHQHTHSENSDHATSDLRNATSIRHHCRAWDAEADPNPDEVELPVAITKPAAYSASAASTGISVPCAWAWKIANTPTSVMAAATGQPHWTATAKPSTRIEKAMPSSTNGTGTPEMPATPPT